MSVALKTLSVVLATLIVATMIPQKDKDYEDINISGDKIVEISSGDIENEEIIQVNIYNYLYTEEFGARGENVNLTLEYNFLKKIAEKMDLEIGYQLKLYLPEYEEQKGEDYSKFQENEITYEFKENREASPVVVYFSNNKLIKEREANLEKPFKPSTIQNEIVYIFEWNSPQNEKNIIGKAQFTINGMNFVIEVDNISHEKFIEIVRTTIEEYKKFEEEFIIEEVSTSSNYAYNLTDKEVYEIIKEETGNENFMEINSKCLFTKDYKKIDVLEEESDVIVIAELEKNEGCTNYNEKAKEYMMIHTLGTLRINKVIKGNLEKNDIIPFINGGGTISYSEYEKGLLPAQKAKSGNIFQTFSTKEKEDFLVKQKIGNNIEIEDGKQYLIFLRYDEQFERYATVGLEYGIREYDEANNLFLNNNTGEYEYLDIEEKIKESTKNIIDMRTYFTLTKDIKDINVLAEDTELIVLAEVEKINGVTNYCEKIDEYTMVFTLGELKINQVIKGDKNISKNIPFKTSGGLISLFEYEKGLEEAQKNKEGSIYTTYTKEEKKNTFLDVQYGNSIELEEGKEYLLFLNYSDNYEMYSVTGLGYGARELDRTTMKIKNNDTNTFENNDLKKLAVKMNDKTLFETKNIEK